MNAESGCVMLFCDVVRGCCEGSFLSGVVTFVRWQREGKKERKKKEVPNGLQRWSYIYVSSFSVGSLDSHPSLWTLFSAVSVLPMNPPDRCV